MPVDKNGAELKEGDLVMVPCRVVRVRDIDVYGNVDLETVEPMQPLDYSTSLYLNSKQLIRTPHAD